MVLAPVAGNHGDQFMSQRTDKTRQIIFLLFGLLAVVLIFLQLQRTKPQPPAELAKLPPGKRIAVVDSSYINLPFLFSIRMPNSKWQLKMLSSDTLLTPFDSTKNIAEQTLSVARAIRLANSDTAALTTFAVMSRPVDVDIRDLSIDYLASLLQRYKSYGRSEILKPVSEPAHSVLKGAYFAVRLPDAADEYPVRVYALLPRKNMIYLIQSKTSDSYYDELYTELEYLVRNIKAIPSLFAH